MVSCTNDEMETTPKKNEQQIVADVQADDIGGQNGQTPIPPPKP
nr:hypothetical protein [uncultured Flavobacterium sp.]